MTVPVDTGESVVTVVIATRDRGDRILRTLHDVLANVGVEFAVIVVDQSCDDRTSRAVQPLLADRRIRFLRGETLGLSNGRNQGVECASTELIAVTDDDCEVPTGWLRSIVEAFSIDPRIGLVFGNVLPAPRGDQDEFTIGYVREKPFLARRINQKLEVEGIAACMAFRRSLWLELSGFDRMLGLGAPMLSGEETDFCTRALQAGVFVFETPDVAVVHHGACPRSRSREVVHRSWFGTGAVYGKHLKRRPGTTARLLLRLAFRFLIKRSRVATSLGGDARRLQRLRAFVSGLASGLGTRSDGASGHFVPNVDR